MTSPVIVSRIQNRRGTQVQFDGYAYNPAGPNSVYPSDTTGAGYYPATPDSNFTPTNYPNVLLPGELALCTDSGRVFLGNLNGGYVELAELQGSGQYLQPISWTLPPTYTSPNPPVWTAVTNTLPGPIVVPLEYSPTPFFMINYNVSDNGSSDWNIVGNNFSRSGLLNITAVTPTTPAPPPPVPASPNPAPWSPVSLTDTGSEVNATPTYDVSFNAYYVSGQIQIWYSHNFPGNLILNTSTLTWTTF